MVLRWRASRAELRYKLTHRPSLWSAFNKRFSRAFMLTTEPRSRDTQFDIYRKLMWIMSRKCDVLTHIARLWLVNYIYFKVLSFTSLSKMIKEALNKCSSPCLASVSVSDLPISGWSGFPHFRLFYTSGLSATCIGPCRAGWMEGLFEVLVLKSHFCDPKWNLLNWFSDSWANSHL